MICRRSTRRKRQGKVRKWKVNQINEGKNLERNEGCSMHHITQGCVCARRSTRVDSMHANSTPMPTRKHTFVWQFYRQFFLFFTFCFKREEDQQHTIPKKWLHHAPFFLGVLDYLLGGGGEVRRRGRRRSAKRSRGGDEEDEEEVRRRWGGGGEERRFFKNSKRFFQNLVLSSALNLSIFIIVYCYMSKVHRKKSHLLMPHNLRKIRQQCAKSSKNSKISFINN